MDVSDILQNQLDSSTHFFSSYIAANENKILLNISSDVAHKLQLWLEENKYCATDIFYILKDDYLHALLFFVDIPDINMCILNLNTYVVKTLKLCDINEYLENFLDAGYVLGLMSVDQTELTVNNLRYTYNDLLLSLF
jgi:hypothetical protein